LVGGIKELGQYLCRAPSIAEALDYLDATLDELLKRGLWSQLLSEAGLAVEPEAPDHERLLKGLRRLCHLDDVNQIHRLSGYLERPLAETALDEIDQRLIEMLHVILWSSQSIGWSISDADARLRQNPSVVQDLRAILEYRLMRAPASQVGRMGALSGPLTVQSQYSRDEILVGLGHWSLHRRPEQREGVLHVAKSRVDAFFVTLQKTEEDYSPTTMYEDYLISHGLFHWQSQSTTSAESPTGQRYVHHQKLGYTPLLFVRDTNALPSGLAAPYVYLGPCDYVSHEGSRPMSIVWRLRHAVPARLFRVMARQNIA